MRHTPTPRHHAAAPPPPPLTPVVLLLLLLLPTAATAQPSRDKDNGGGEGAYSNMPPRPRGFSAPMVVLLVALIAAFFFVGFFSVYIRRCGRGDSSSSAGGITAAALLALSRQEQRNREQQQRRGLDPEVVASFPVMRCDEARALRVGGKDAALECAVCLSEFQDDEELRLLPRCSHAFHPDCIGEWLAGHVTCPVCRCNLDPDAEALAEAAEEAAADGSGGAEEAEQPDHHQQVAVDVGPEAAADADAEEAMELDRIGSQRRAVRSRPPLVPRSHSTGHSLAARLDGDLERFTLRLPEHVRREMVAAAGEESLRRSAGRRAREEARGARSARLGRSDRWPSLIARTLSSRVPFWAAPRRAPDAAAEAGAAEAPTTAARTSKRETKADGSVTPPKGSVRFDCLGGVGGGAVSGARVGAAAGDSEAEEEDDDEEKAIAPRV